MVLSTQLVVLLIVLAIGVIATLVLRPHLTDGPAGRALAFLGFFLIPATAVWGGFWLHFEATKKTEFCLSCHVMEPYGESLYVDDEWYLPASHFQNRRIDREKACFTCHTTYTMYGDLEAKLNGLKHLIVYYTGKTPEKIELYKPYQNRECLHCHEGARAYIEMHEDELAEFASNETSCLECHDMAHDVESLDDLDRWEAPTDG